MMKLLVAAGLVLCASAFKAPVSYYAKGTISLPYAGITEPFETWFDGTNNLQRIEYYGGMDTFVMLQGKKTMYQVNPVYNSNKCFATQGDGVGATTSLFPDPTGFKLDGQFTVNGVMCDNWVLVNTVEGRVNTYHFYVSTVSSLPVAYEWVGYDTLLGSHFDQYRVEYTTVVPMSEFGKNNFTKPDMDCSGFPGPGYTNPGASLATMFPNADAGYSQFAKDHGKGVEASREVDFRRNVRYVHMRNRVEQHKGQSLRLAVNFLADATSGEMAKRAGVNDRKRPVSNGANYTHVAPVDMSTNPSSVNWTAKGAVTKVKDQGICGSCWSFGAAETIEGSHFLRTGELVELSQQELMDCDWEYGSLACDGGEDFRAYDWILQNNDGILHTAASYGPYLMADGRCHNKQSGLVAGATIVGFANVTVGSESALVDALANHGPISVAIDASLQSFSFYSSGVYYDAACKNGADDLDHQVLATGYGSLNGEEYFIVKNSWSTHWGDNGYVLMSRGRNNNCGIATDATYAMMPPHNK